MMTENITNPKLKEAMGEIEEILKKHDIAAVIALHTPGHGEIKLHIAPTYSVARMVREPDEHGAMREGIMINTKDMPAGEEKLQAMTDTANMFNLLTTMLCSVATFLVDVDEGINQQVSVEHSPLLTQSLDADDSSYSPVNP